MARNDVSSPRIESVSWGRLHAGGAAYKDAKLFPGGSREWDWNETGTSHEPGVGPADVEELLANGATTVVFGTGFYGRLRVREEALRVLEENNVTAHALQTEEAVKLYNGLREDEKVGALIHSTC